jgi:hypothetical protein
LGGVNHYSICARAASSAGLGKAVLDPFDVSASHSFDLATQLQVTPNLGIVQHTKAINQRKGLSDLPKHSIGVQAQVRLVAHREHQRIDSP